MVLSASMHEQPLYVEQLLYNMLQQLWLSLDVPTLHGTAL